MFLCYQVHDKIGSEMSSADSASTLSDDIIRRCMAAVDQAKKVLQLLTNQVGQYQHSLLIMGHGLMV